MDFEHALQLINHPVVSKTAQSIWADLGAGAGLFTNALASKLTPGSKIYAVDKTVELSVVVKNSMVEIENITADFTSDKLSMGNLDGILMANSLHFVLKKMEFLASVRPLLKNTGCFLIIEYDLSTANAWVPYPLAFQSLQPLFSSIGFQKIEKIHEHPSRYHRADIYSALILRNP